VGGLAENVEAPPEAPPETIEPWRLELLELAFDAASRMPLHPHIKNRSRAQAEVVEACLTLGEFERARRFADRIANWQRGEAYGKLAHRAAIQGDLATAERHQAEARAIATGAIESGDQEWRAQVILEQVAMTELALDRPEAVHALERELEDSERRELARAKARLLPREDLDLQLAEYRRLVELKSFELMQGVLGGALELHERFYRDEQARAELEEFVGEAARTMPSTLRFEYGLELCEHALEHGDSAQAGRLAEAARATLEASTWTPDVTVPATARLGAAFARAGDATRGEALLGSSLTLFGARRDEIPDVFRGDTLRPVAEALWRSGEREEALDVFRQLVEEGALNPNARPRAVDLVRTCCALATAGIQPDEPLLGRLRELSAGLVEPW